MRLTAMDINNKEFRRAMRGYNPDDVDEFLDKIAEDYEVLYKENSTLKEKVVAMNERLEHYGKIETTIQNTLLLAQNAAEQAKVTAQKEAELLIKSSNDTAQKILDKAHNDVMSINEEYDVVKQEFVKFRAKFRNFMKAQMETFDDLEKDFVKNYSIGKIEEEEIADKVQPVDNPFNFKELDEDGFKDDDLSEIKSFFVKES
jgi:cell division initiation protein